jgi:transposase
MLEIKELLRLWLDGMGAKPIAARLGMDPKTVRRYLRAARGQGLAPEQGPGALTEEAFTAVLVALQDPPGRPRGESWAVCASQREFIQGHLKHGVRLTKVAKLLRRRGIEVPYGTLYRFAVAELGFGRRTVTLRVADCGPGEELQVDTGWVGSLEPDAGGIRRRIKAFIFTAVRSRHRFVYPTPRETTACAIEACEVAWEFFGGVFRVLIPDNTKAIVDRADPLHPRLNPTFLEYAQARGFHIDTARVRRAQDKGRVERAVPTVRDDCFAGERLWDLAHTRDHARRWCLTEYGLRRHSTTGRLPLEHFEAEERPVLLPAPTTPYAVPLWADPKVGRDHYAQVDKAIYSLPTLFIGKRLRARADATLVRFYHGGALVKTHPRQPPGGRSTDESDFPPEKAACARRDVDFFVRKAQAHGDAVGRFATRLLDCPLPWTRMRRVYALVGLARRYGDQRLDAACERALTHDMIDVRRLERMLRLAVEPQATPTAAVALPAARFLRPSDHFALTRTPNPKGDTP